MLVQVFYQVEVMGQGQVLDQVLGMDRAQDLVTVQEMVPATVRAMVQVTDQAILQPREA